MKQKLRVFCTLLLLAVASVGWGQTTVTDELNNTLTGVTGTNYSSWSGKTSKSSAVYAGLSAGGNSSIQLRSSNNNSGIISTQSGGKLKKIVITWNSNTTSGRTINIYGKSEAYAAVTDVYDQAKRGTLLGTIVYGTSTELTVDGDYEYIGMRSASGAMYIDKIEITWDVAGSTTETCATPSFTPAAGVYTSVQNVTISSATDGAKVYYTTDGAEPTTSSSVYSSAISVSQTTTIKAMAVKDGMENSTVATATYAILDHAGTAEDPYTVADARNAIDANTGVTGVYATGIVSEIVTAYSSQYGNISYNISVDGTTTSDQLQAFRGKSYNGANFTSEDDIQVGDVVVVYGTLKNYNGTYEFDANNQLVSLERAADVEAPEFAPEGGAYMATQSVTITTATEGATIY